MEMDMNGDDEGLEFNFDGGGGVGDEDPRPDDLVFACQPLALAFHPSENLIASGLVSGEVNLHRYVVGNNANECVVDGSKKALHQAACRAVRFDSTGKFLFSTGTDMALNVIDVNTLQVKHRNPRIHEKPVTAMISYAENMLATGCDEGVVKIWDMRQQKECCKLHDNEDYISDLCYSEEHKRLLAAGGDGFLCVFNPRQGKLEARSDNMEDELLTARWVKNGKKAVVGTQEGVLLLFSNGDWGDCSDRFPGHPESIDAMVVIDDDTIVTGSSDGMLRIVQILPNQLLGVIGEHADFPIEGVEMSYNKAFLASSSHDNLIKFWSIDYLFDEGEENDDGEGAPMDLADIGEVDNRDKSVSVKDKGLSKTKEKKAEFFSGL